MVQMNFYLDLAVVLNGCPYMTLDSRHQCTKIVFSHCVSGAECFFGFGLKSGYFFLLLLFVLFWFWFFKTGFLWFWSLSWNQHLSGYVFGWPFYLTVSTLSRRKHQQTKPSFSQDKDPSLVPEHIFLKDLFIMYITFCLHVCMQARRGHQISLQMVVSHHMGCWELNSGLLEEQPVLLTSEPPLQFLL